MKRLIILVQLLLCVWAGDYDADHLVNCSAIPTNTTDANLSYLW